MVSLLLQAINFNVTRDSEISRVVVLKDGVYTDGVFGASTVVWMETEWNAKVYFVYEHHIAWCYLEVE